MRYFSVLFMSALFTLLAFSMLSCDKLDVVGNYSVSSFGALLQNAPQLLTEDTLNKGWSIHAPDNSVRFIWSRNFAESPLFDVMFEIDAAPFIAAGLAPSRLPDNYLFNEGKLITGAKLGTEQPRYDGEAAPLAAYQQIVKLRRGSIAYHMAMDHFGVNLGSGNLFEWAKDMQTNDLDIVFVLDPGPLVRAGLNPDRVEGWVFTKVPAEDANGRMIEADKILKPFNL